MKIEELHIIKKKAETGEADLNMVLTVLCELFLSQSANIKKANEKLDKVMHILEDVKRDQKIILEQQKSPLFQLVEVEDVGEEEIDSLQNVR